MSKTITMHLPKPAVDPDELRRAFVRLLREQIGDLFAENVQMQVWGGTRRVDVHLSNQALEALGLPLSTYSDGLGVNFSARGPEIVADHHHPQTPARVSQALQSLGYALANQEKIRAQAARLGLGTPRLEVDWQTGNTRIRLTVGGSSVPAEKQEAVW